MSKLGELIQQYCPNGVEYKELWEVTIWDKKFNAVEKSMQPKIIKYHYYLAKELEPLITENGNIKILTTNTTNLFTSEELVKDNLSTGEIIAIPWGGNPNVQYYNGRFITADNRIATASDFNTLNVKFLYYYLQSKLEEISLFYRGSGIKHPSMLSVLTMSIPIPILEIQNEIVRILDQYTETKDKLINEINSELLARQKQYEYYRNSLLNFEDLDNHLLKGMLQQYCPVGVKYIQIEDIFQISRGRVMSKDYLRDNLGEFPVYSSQTQNNGIFGYIDNYDYDFESLTWTTDGANAGSIFYHNNEKFSITNVCGLLKPLNNSNINIKFAYYCLTIVAKKYVNAAMGNPKLMSNVVSKIPLPVPPIEIQNEIVKILEKYDSLVNDIKTGLPAEIEARQNQYEYYRDKLLTFKELEL